MDNTEEILYNMFRERLLKDIEPRLDEMVNIKVACRTKDILEALYDLPLNVEQVAILTGENKRTVYAWRERNQIEFYKANGRIHTTLGEIIKKLMGSYPLR